MNEFEKQFGDHAESTARALGEAESTLRLVAQQPAPADLAERVHQRLGRERLMFAEEPEDRGFWRLWLPIRRIQFAGAAAVAGVLAVSMLIVRHPQGKAPATQTPGVAQTPIPVPAQSGAFGTGAAQGHPRTLTPIPVPQAQAKKKKPSAAHTAKHSSQAARGETQAAPVTTRPEY
ncbi:MAG TPA: hypothetical protein VL346_12040 [Acidobacteriaceae bacterium]|nr:hypothetical protein [Acidobacteriaceae bacterium]